MTRHSFYLIGLFALILLTLGCRDTTAPVVREGCVGPVQVAVRQEPTPVIGWAPACGVSAVWVVTVPSAGATEEVMWFFSVPENAPIGPSIRYGVTPAGITFWSPAQPLVTGTSYRVRVMQTVGGDVVVAGGEKVFTH